MWGGGSAPTTFCTISESRGKGPPAIWQHLEPILVEIRENWPDVSTIHFFSDGPCTQYKQRGNLYLFCTEIYKKGFTRGTWNYFEASHGKGAPDGVGGALKRRKDKLVSQGFDIPTALSLYQALSEGKSKVKLFYIPEQAVEDAIKQMPSDIPAVPTTMRIHQVVTLSPGKILYRDMTQLKTTNITPEVVQWHSPEVVGKWCALVYDHIIYPGIIQEDVLTLIPPPENVTSRHMAIAREVWDTLASHEK
ncbi:putative polyketide synthase 1 [Dissostichus eleginoides]|uniref:Polyketide synthase 1 n=1 Tax=Dissostichus eleginoides TaxID=100907 RepID=A0AAD9BL25_DISEL|nr:putative polyketide synthase 1 [Dissostichus eleginoides]